MFRVQTEFLSAAVVTLLLLFPGGLPSLSTAQVPLNDLGSGTYQGFEGGLYSGGELFPPAGHLADALDQANQIVPRDAQGLEAENGLIGFISIGMSNTTQEFSEFVWSGDPGAGRNARIVIVDGAQSGKSAQVTANRNAGFWDVVKARVAAAGMSNEQVQVCWVKQADSVIANTSFPLHAEVLQQNLEETMRNIRFHFPNVRIAFCSSRIYGGYSTNPQRNEPLSYETGFSYKWLIEDQVAGSATLNFDPAAGPVEAPLLLWGPYLWADAMTPRSDGLTWEPGDFQGDMIHPGEPAEQKVSRMIAEFFAQDQVAQAFWAPVPDATLVVLDAAEDTSSDSTQPGTNFGAQATLFAENSTTKRAWLKFDLSGLEADPESSTLAIRNRNTNLEGLEVYGVSDSSWEEMSLTHDNAPAIDGLLHTTMANVGSDATGVAGIDISELVGPPEASFALLSAPVARLSSREEAGRASRLQLVVPTSVEAVPLSMVVVTGVSTTGTVADVAVSDDVDASIIRNPLSVNSVVEFDLKADSFAANPAGIRFTYESSVFARGAVSQTISMFNYQSNAFQLVDTRPASRFVDSVVEVNAPGNPTRFVDPATGDVKVRIRYEGNSGRLQFSANIDQAIWRFE